VFFNHPMPIVYARPVAAFVLAGNQSLKRLQQNAPARWLVEGFAAIKIALTR